MRFTLTILIYLDIFIAMTLRYALEMAEHETPPMSNIIHMWIIQWTKGTYSVNVLVFLNSCRYNVPLFLEFGFEIEPGQMVPMAYLTSQPKHIHVLQSSRGASRWDAPSEYRNECFRANLCRNAVNWARLVGAFISKESSFKKLRAFVLY